jgi:putative ABC transport system substrate-binding protein
VRRRDFINILGSAAAWPLPLHAQQAAKVYRIGYLGGTSHAEYTREIEALLKGLRQLGYEEGKNIAIHYEFASQMSPFEPKRTFPELRPTPS